MKMGTREEGEVDDNEKSDDDEEEAEIWTVSGRVVTSLVPMEADVFLPFLRQ
jgi:hypothetical protein